MPRKHLGKMAGLPPRQESRISACNLPHMFEITHRNPADNVNCTCECHSAEDESGLWTVLTRSLG